MTRSLFKSVGMIFILCATSYLMTLGMPAWAQEKMPARVKIVAPLGFVRIYVKPDTSAEMMQIALDAEVYETVSEQGPFYEIRVPDKNITGYVLKSDTEPWKDQVKKTVPTIYIVVGLLIAIGLGAGAYFGLRAKKDLEAAKYAAAIPNAIKRAEESFRSGDYVQAIEGFNQYLRLQGGEVRNPDVYRRLAACHQKIGEVGKAAENWEKMRELGGVKTVDDYSLGVELMLGQGKEAAAAELYEDLLTQEAAADKELEIRQKLVDAYRKLKDTRKLLKHVVSLMGLSGSDRNLLPSTVNYLISESQTDVAIEFDRKELIVAICREFLEDKAMTPQAERIYLKCLAYDRTDVKLHKMLATMYSRSGDFRKAVSELIILAQIDKDQTEGYIEEAARLYVESGNVPEALGEGNPMIVKKIAQIFLARSEVHPHAVETYEKVLEFQPRAVGINKMLSTVYLTRGELDKYMAKLRLLYEIDGQNRDYLTDLALCIIDNDLIDQTLKEGNRELNTKILRQLIKRGATNDKAVALLEKLARTEPENVVVRGALIKAYERRGDPVKCFEHLMAAIRVQPKDRDLIQKAATMAVQHNLLDRVIENRSATLVVATAQELMKTQAKLTLTRQVVEQAVAAVPGQKPLADYLKSLPPDKRGPSAPAPVTREEPPAAPVTTGVTKPRPGTATTRMKQPSKIAEVPKQETKPRKTQKSSEPTVRLTEKDLKSSKTRIRVSELHAADKKESASAPKRPTPPTPAPAAPPPQQKPVQTAASPTSEVEEAAVSTATSSPSVSSVTPKPPATEQIVEFFESETPSGHTGATTFVSGYAKDRNITDYKPEELYRPATGGLAYKDTDVLVNDGWGTISFGIEVNTNRSVLIRLLKKDLLERSSMKSFVDDVSEVMYNLRHQNILALEEVVTGIAGTVGLVHPYVFKTLEQAMKFGKRPQMSTILSLMNDLIAAMQHAHHYQGLDGKYRRTYHFHLQPSLVMVSEDLRDLRVTGFGFSQVYRTFTRASKPRWQEPGMNPATMPPEFFRSRIGTIREKAADIYSMGVVLYFMATGEYPFEGPSFEDYKFGHTKMIAAPSRLANPAVPEWVDHIILKCLEKDPEKRWDDIAEIKQAFDEGKG